MSPAHRPRFAGRCPRRIGRVRRRRRASSAPVHPRSQRHDLEHRSRRFHASKRLRPIVAHGRRQTCDALGVVLFKDRNDEQVVGVGSSSKATESDHARGISHLNHYVAVSRAEQCCRGTARTSQRYNTLHYFLRCVRLSPKDDCHDTSHWVRFSARWAAAHTSGLGLALVISCTIRSAATADQKDKDKKGKKASSRSGRRRPVVFARQGFVASADLTGGETRRRNCTAPRPNGTGATARSRQRRRIVSRSRPGKAMFGGTGQANTGTRRRATRSRCN